MDTFSERELAYLACQRLGRLATVDSTGTPQNSPVEFRVAEDRTVRIHGLRLGDGGRGSWRREGARRPRPGIIGDEWEEIRIRPERIVSWGLDDENGP